MFMLYVEMCLKSCLQQSLKGLFTVLLKDLVTTCPCEQRPGCASHGSPAAGLCSSQGLAPLLSPALAAYPCAHVPVFNPPLP